MGYYGQITNLGLLMELVDIMNKTSRAYQLTILICIFAMPCGWAQAGVVFGNTGLAGGFRWDAAPKTLGGVERSLAGGLRYSVQGGSWQAYRDSFSWSGTTPTVAAFQSAVEGAFSAWTGVDPVSNLGTSLSFVSDFQTNVDSSIVAGVRMGAEIDLFASNLNDAGTRGFSFFNALGSTLTLTSGVTNYNAGSISGADVTINSNPGALYTIDLFRRLLAHELGHAIGLGDVEGDINPSFIDDNFNPNDPLGTLTNSWAGLVDPLNPAASLLSIYSVPPGSTGVGAAGVDILMESRGLGISPNNSVFNLSPLSNDDYGMRQFLYPQAVPEPAALSWLVAAVLVGGLRRRLRVVLTHHTQSGG